MADTEFFYQLWMSENHLQVKVKSHMSIQKKLRFLTSGKVKDIYELDTEPDCLLFRFSDRVSAYDVKFSEKIPLKGNILCRSAEFWFERLSVPNHFVRRQSDTEIIVKKMQMLPIECIVRGHLYGSLYDRWQNGIVTLPDGSEPILASKLSEPMFDPTTKSEYDIPVDKQVALHMKLVTDEQYDWLATNSVMIYEQMSNIANSAGFILADLKLEFGILDGKLMLGDSIGPDEYRLWPKDTFEPGRIQEAYDKQILRDWLAAHGYKSQFEEERRAGREPRPPIIPDNVVSAMTRRYVDSFEKISGMSL